MSHDNVSGIARQIIAKFELLKQGLYVIIDDEKCVLRKTNIIRSVSREHHFFPILLTAISHDLLNEMDIQNQQSDLVWFVDPTETGVLSSC
jgi:hypothetical protein